MHHAIRHNRTSHLERLLQHPTCNIRTVNKEGLSLLHYAALYDHVGSTEMTRLLLDHKDQDLNVTATLDEGSTPLCLALYNPEMVKLLLERGARVALPTPRGPTTPLIEFIVFDYPLLSGPTFTTKNLRKSIKLLKGAGLDFEHRGEWDSTAFLLAATHMDISHMSEAVTTILELGARVDACNGNGNVLHNLADSFCPYKRGDLPKAALLIDVDPDATNRRGQTPLCMRKALALNSSYYSWRGFDVFPAFLDEIRDLRAARQATSTGTVEEV